MNEYLLSEKQSSLILINTKTGAEGGVFWSQLEAVETIIEMIGSKTISAEHGSDIFNQVVKSKIAFDCIVSKTPQEIIKERILNSKKIYLAQVFISQVIMSQKHDGPYLWICDNCKDHAVIFYPEGRSSSFETKKDGLKIINSFYENQVINFSEKIELENAVKICSLPDQKIKSHLN